MIEGEFVVKAPTAGGPVSYRVVAKDSDAAIFMVVNLQNSLHAPLTGAAEALTSGE